ncbi:anthranilate synthase component I family protein [Chitinophaga qingshengii]|uniref:Anthranilate synthase component I family protein n=1 Tax=Chitinophaga qingshengii TaxID=1569794 RepID=A0ABR7TP83_9BACT|nr:anthranilate synthase component I family protein [Chitinophaga qingshengii]MBC9930834.1 anthranilate synthase component I family protein [Chitinophaga qingshengii]
MLNWGNQFNICCLLDNNNYPSDYHRFEALLAADALQTLEADAGNAFPALEKFYARHSDWLFGHLAYDLKNETVPGLHSQNPDGTGFPDMHFFQPRVVIFLKNNEAHIGGIHFTVEDATAVYRDVIRMPVTVNAPSAPRLSALQARLNHTRYIDAVKGLQAHILRGDCYEVNFCRENFMEDASVYPPALFSQLNALSPAPFAAYYRLQDRYLISSSPERYLQKTGNTVISQPIKGTSRKDPDPVVDKALQEALRNHPKERAENIMVVDLVRNDLSHTALRGSVHVKELCGIYSFAQVHQMISTIAAEMAPGTRLTDILQHTFPMGSMTGAPKIRVMQLIEEYEQSRRGLYSGAVGYITPEGDFDFNVVIRSIIYNASRQYLSFQTGSAITFYSNPQLEWEECLLKAAAMVRLFE